MGQRCGTEKSIIEESTDAAPVTPPRNKENKTPTGHDTCIGNVQISKEEKLKELNGNVPIAVPKKMKEKHLFDDAGSYLNISVDTEKSLKTVVQWRKPANEVYISGSFCNWKDRIQLTKSGDIFWAALELADGDYEVKFVVDGTWSYTDDLPTTDDGLGGFNNILHIQRKTDEL